MRSLARAAAIGCLAGIAASPLAAAADEVPWWDAMEAVGIAEDAYIYGYPLVTFDMVRQQQTNVAVPDAEHAPMGQIIKMRTYPAVDNHCCAAPNADTLYTEVWLDVSREPWVRAADLFTKANPAIDPGRHLDAATRAARALD